MLFLKESNNDLLLDLESLTDVKSSFMRIKRYFDYEAESFDISLFGKYLFGELGRIYHSKIINIDIFAKKCYELYTILPDRVNPFENPYIWLCNIDDMIEFNSPQEIEKKIEEMLLFYE